MYQVPGPTHYPYSTYNQVGTGIFPDKWKVSYVLPVFKGRTLVNNYRPFCINSIIPEQFESIIYCKTHPLFKHIIDGEQHGFVLGKSTITNLLVFQHFVLNIFKSDYQVDVIYTDFSKTFDANDHSILYFELFFSGLRDLFHSWFVSFLSDRHQYMLTLRRNFKSFIS